MCSVLSEFRRARSAVHPHCCRPETGDLCHPPLRQRQGRPPHRYRPHHLHQPLGRRPPRRRLQPCSKDRPTSRRPVRRRSRPRPRQRHRQTPGQLRSRRSPSSPAGAVPARRRCRPSPDGQRNVSWHTIQMPTATNRKTWRPWLGLSFLLLWLLLDDGLNMVTGTGITLRQACTQTTAKEKAKSQALIEQ